MLMEPWDGPAALVFTDGIARRRHARPQRAAPRPLPRHRRRPRRARAARSACSTSTRAASCARAACSPGRMFLVDTEAGRLIEDDEIKAELAASEPVAANGSTRGRIRLADLPEREHIVHPTASVTRRQRTFGYTEEEVRILLDADGSERRGAARRDGLGHPDRRALRASAAAVRLLHPAVRAGHQPAARLDPRRGRHLARPRSAPSATC